jgi:hypothetical protein
MSRWRLPVGDLVQDLAGLTFRSLDAEKHSKLNTGTAAVLWSINLHLGSFWQNCLCPCIPRGFPI